MLPKQKQTLLQNQVAQPNQAFKADLAKGEWSLAQVLRSVARNLASQDTHVLNIRPSQASWKPLFLWP